jgi:transposase
MSSKKRSHRFHSPEFKAEAVRMVLEQKLRKTEVCRNLDISPSLLDAWIKSFRETGCAAGPGSGTGKSQDSSAKRVRELERELERVKMERDILKKAAAYFAREST